MPERHFQTTSLGRVCEVGAWSEQPHLAQVRRIRLWGWVRLHTCGAGANQSSKDKTAITAHTRMWRGCVMVTAALPAECSKSLGGGGPLYIQEMGYVRPLEAGCSQHKEHAALI